MLFGHASLKWDDIKDDVSAGGIGVAPALIYLHTVGYFLAVGQDLCQVLGAQDVPQGGLR